VIFLDEPLANVDFESIGDIISIVKDWKESGTSFVIISHIWEPLVELADYIVVISAGRIYLKGGREEVENMFKSSKFFHRGFS